MLQDNNNFDFKYADFSLRGDVLESYVKSAIAYKKSVKDPENSYDHSSGIVDCVISCIASQKFSFDKNNKRAFKVLYKMLRDYACNNGVYTDEARTAMRVLCEYCGFTPDAIVLTDRKPLSRMERLKNRFSKWLRFEEEHDDQEDKIDQMFDAIAQQKKRAKYDALVAEAEKRRVELRREHERKEQERIAKLQRLQEEAACRAKAKQDAENRVKTVLVPVMTTAPAKAKKTKYKYFAKIGATVTGFVALGATMLFGPHGSAHMTTSPVNNNEPTFKKIDVGQTAHYNKVTTYNMIDSLKKQKSNLDSVMQYRVRPVVKLEQKQTIQNTEDQQVAESLTKASRSALNILIGAERTQKLCDNIQSKVKAGIFKLPQGMSVECVAHAMEMSRIYECHSIILDALNSNVKLTVEQQRAFDNHIAGIGDLGVKLQKRMAAQHNLSKHSRYDNAKKSLRMAHAKNLKQLKQIKKHMR